MTLFVSMKIIISSVILALLIATFAMAAIAAPPENNEIAVIEHFEIVHRAPQEACGLPELPALHGRPWGKLTALASAAGAIPAKFSFSPRGSFTATAPVFRMR